MGLSRDQAHEHIEHWRRELKPARNRAFWPSFLFHATDVRNAVEVLRSGALRCRSQLGEDFIDAANQGALWNNPAAHSYVRLYFRPRTVFHLKTEGIKYAGDPYREGPQMAVPVMLVFAAEEILAQESVGFSNGMWSKKRPIGFDRGYFARIDFAQVYSDHWVDDSKKRNLLQDARMAEALVPGQLPLRPSLRRVVCRSPLDRRTLLHLLGAAAASWADDVGVELRPQSVSLHKALYLTKVAFHNGRLELGFHHPPRSPKSDRFEVRVLQRVQGELIHKWRGQISSTWSGALIPSFEEIPGAVWTIELEGELAYQASIPSETSIVL